MHYRFRCHVTWCPWESTWSTGVCILKGALDKYDINSFISKSVEDSKLNQYRNFQLILPMRFHFMRCFVNSIISRVSHWLLYCIYWSRLWKIENTRNIHISSKVSQSTTWNSVCSHFPRQHFKWYKNPNFFGEKLGDDVTLVQCPFKEVHGGNSEKYIIIGLIFISCKIQHTCTTTCINTDAEGSTCNLSTPDSNFKIKSMSKRKNRSSFTAHKICRSMYTVKVLKL